MSACSCWLVLIPLLLESFAKDKALSSTVPRPTVGASYSVHPYPFLTFSALLAPSSTPLRSLPFTHTPLLTTYDIVPPIHLRLHLHLRSIHPLIPMPSLKDHSKTAHGQHIHPPIHPSPVKPKPSPSPSPSSPHQCHPRVSPYCALCTPMPSQLYYSSQKSYHHALHITNTWTRA